MVERYAECADGDAGEEHPSNAESDAFDLDFAEQETGKDGDGQVENRWGKTFAGEKISNPFHSLN